MLLVEKNKMGGSHEALGDLAAATLQNYLLNYLKYSSHYLIKATQLYNPSIMKGNCLAFIYNLFKQKWRAAVTEPTLKTHSHGTPN